VDLRKRRTPRAWASGRAAVAAGASLMLRAFGPRNGPLDHFVRANCANRTSPRSRHKIPPAQQFNLVPTCA